MRKAAPRQILVDGQVFLEFPRMPFWRRFLGILTGWRYVGPGGGWQ
jgi:hypothetical protein